MVCFYNCCLGYGTCSFQYTNATPWGAHSPCCHHGAANYSNTQAIAVQPDTHSLLGQDSAHTGKVPCPRVQHHSAAAETVPETSQSKVRGRSHRATTPCMYMEYVFNIGTLRGSLPGSLSSSVVPLRPTQCQWDGSAIYVVMRAVHEKYTVSNVKGREINLHKPLPRRASNPGPPAWEARTLPLRSCSL